MPQKLIRLTTPEQNTSGNCIFTGLFNEDLKIKENSEIALQSVSLERKSQELTIKNSNHKILFASVGSPGGLPSGSNQTARITPSDLYNKSNDEELLANIKHALNRVCSMFDSADQMNIQYGCDTDGNGKVRIQGRVSPFYTLDQGYSSDLDARAFPAFANSDQPVQLGIIGSEAVETGDAGGGASGIFRDTDTTSNPADPAESYLYSDVPFIKSTGALRVRLQQLTGTGGQESAYIGLVKGRVGFSKLDKATLTEADMEYAIRINGNNTAIDFKKTAADAFATTGVTPINFVPGTTAANDVLEIVIEKDKLVGQIHQNNAVGGGGADIKTTLASGTVDEDEDYYWFISFIEGKGKVVLDDCSVSLDPFVPINTKPGSEFLTSRDDNNQALKTSTSVLSTIVDYNRDASLTPIMRLSSDVASFLGWPSGFTTGNVKPFALKGAEVISKVQAFDGNTSTNYDLSLGFLFVAPEPYDNSYEADNYIIDTQSFLLDSYDSYGLSPEERNAKSGGSRRNILATVPMSEEPVANTGNGVVQYQPNTLNFIRIRNRSDVITRQLRFRLLTGRYQDVQIQNMAALTLLIRDPEGYEEE